MPRNPSPNSKLPGWLQKFPKSLRREIRSSTTSETVDNQALNHSPRRTDAPNAPDSAENPDNHLLSPNNIPDSLRHRRSRSSSDSAHLSLFANHTEPRRPSTSPKPAVRLPNQEQAVDPPDATRLKASQVLCTLIVKYHDALGAHVKDGTAEPRNETEVLLARVEDAIIEFEEETAFEELGAIATKELQRHTGRPPEAFYLKVGRFRLIRHDSAMVVSRCILESKREWDEYLPWKILEFRGQNRGKPFHIEIEWEYSSLHIEQVPGQTYAETIGSAIEGKIRENWEGRKYVPEKDLERILTKDTISQLIHEDRSLYSAKALTLTHGTKLDAEKFIDDLWKWGSRLLALCVYADLPLVCLYHMWLRGLRDGDLPLAKGDCPEPHYRRKFDMAVSISGGFAAHTFDKNEEGKLDHLQLLPGVVVPILFDKEDPEHVLGQGSFGKVYKVRIDRDHHSFSDFEDEAFAFKIFYDLSAHTPKDVENESGTLARLAEAPHANITTHLASWNQSGICYMLFRCADCNLRTYMKKESPRLTKAILLALLSQMRGLADGLRHIHNLGPSNLEPDRVNEKAKPGQNPRSQTCFHHDLKPANILVTTNPDTGSLLFSISDFGSARIGQILSGSMQRSPFTKSLSPGDAVYGAPDAVLQGETSRPYDLWSMGCILLELLTWIVGPEEDCVQRFADRRMDKVANAHGNQDQAFWYQNTAGRLLLKPAVVHQLEDLKEKCRGRGVLPALVRIVGKLLRLLPSQRAEASKLFSDLDAVLIQARRDFKNENFYIDHLTTRPEVPIAAPPSSVGEGDDLERTPSIDLHAVAARFGDTLGADLRANRRSTVGSVHPTVTPNRHKDHERHHSTPEAAVDPKHFAPLDIDTRIEPSSPTNGDEVLNTPRLSISDFDNDSARTEAFLHIGPEDGILPPIGSHNASFAPRLSRNQSSDSQVLVSD